MPNTIRIGIIGLGYIGLPVAVAFAEQYPVVGYDHNPTRIAELQRGQDRTREVEPEALQAVAGSLTLTTDAAALAACTVYIVTVPTPVDTAKRPDLGPLLNASATVGRVLKRGDVVIYESTVYPGCTEDDCVPVLERESGLRFNDDFTVGYSPERLSPGDRTRRLTDIVKITSGSTPAAADFVDSLYGSIVRAGTYRAPSIRVAEAAKLVENAQRDVNISFVNELALLFDRLDLDTHEVLAAAATKWNFLPFRPGLVGGHCISVDPYYLIHKAEQVGYSPQVIASGRRVNEYMPVFVANKLMKLMVASGIPLQNARVLVLGITYKENCPDIRDSRVVDVVRELQQFGIEVDVYDPWADAGDVETMYGIRLVEKPGNLYEGILLTVAHDLFQTLPISSWQKPETVLLDIKGTQKESVLNVRL